MTPCGVPGRYRIRVDRQYFILVRTLPQVCKGNRFTIVDHHGDIATTEVGFAEIAQREAFLGCGLLPLSQERFRDHPQHWQSAGDLVILGMTSNCRPHSPALLLV